MTHSELCYQVANKYNRQISLIEYKTTICNEEPDVITFNSYGESFLYEIKTSYSDFKNDYKKPFRIIHKVETRRSNTQFIISTLNDSLGKYRFYVCPKGLLKLEDIPFGWGLIYYDIEKNKFHTKRDSMIFKHNKGLENRLLINAIRRLNNGINNNLIINDYIGIKNGK